MPSQPARPAPPALRFHARTKMHYVWVGRQNGGRRYMGRDFGQAQVRYAAFCDEWRAARSAVPPPAIAAGPATVAGVLAAYWRHRKREGTGPKDLGRLKAAVRFARKYHGAEPASAFRGRTLKALRKRMLRAPCRRVKAGRPALPLSRVYVNRLVNDLKAAWRWAASEDLVPTEAADNLATVGAVRKHKGGREVPRVTDVEPWAVAATLPHLHRIAADMVRVQQLAGMRPGELCALRRRDVSTCSMEKVPLPESNKQLAAFEAGDGPGRSTVWLAIPESHKTLWRGRTPRVIVLGPKAQAVLRPYLDRAPDAYLFSPREAVEAWRRAQGRTIAHAASRTPGERYTTESYGRAVAAGIRRANRDREEGAPEVPPWRPNQLRHAAATEASEQFDRATASALLGNGMDIIDRYVEQELKKAARAAAAIG